MPCPGEMCVLRSEEVMKEASEVQGTQIHLGEALRELAMSRNSQPQLGAGTQRRDTKVLL